jgi:glycosyltransferase involved in cell wall biosynthesis
VKIAIDTRWIFRELSGVGQVTQHLVRELARRRQEDDYLLLFDQDEVRVRTAEATGYQENEKFTAVTVPYGVFSPRAQWSLPRLLRQRGIEVYHAPNYLIPYPAFPRNRPGPIRCVVTIHDVIPLLFPDHAPRSRKARLFPLYRRLMRETAARADVITTVSQASRKDVIEQLGIPAEREARVVSIYNGVEPRPATSSRGNRGPAQLLAVGRFDPYKNLPLLVRAFAALRRDRFPDLGLRIIGPPDPRYPEAQETARREGVFAAITWSGYVSGEELLRAFGEADCLVQPSRYEGFGLPLLEAMMAGTPVVCARAGAMPEVVGDAALLVEPDDVGALAAAIARILDEPPLRARLREAGLARARSFTWTRTADQTVAAYRLACS